MITADDMEVATRVIREWRRSGDIRHATVPVAAAVNAARLSERRAVVARLRDFADSLDPEETPLTEDDPGAALGRAAADLRVLLDAICEQDGA